MASMIKRNGKWLSKPFKDPLTGKRTTKQFDTKDLAEAYERACAQAVDNGLTYLPQAASVTNERTLQAVCSATLSERYSMSRPRTRETFAQLYTVLQRVFGPDTPASDVLTKQKMTAWVGEMQDKAPATRNLYRVAISGLAAQAGEQGLCAPFKLRGEKLANARDRYLTPDEEDKLLVLLSDDVRRLSRFAVLTGLRLSEALSVRPEDAAGGSVLRVIGKGNKIRHVPLNPEANTLLTEYAHTFADLSPDTVQRQFRRATQRLGFKDVSFHTLRHTTASRLAQAGVGLLQLQQFMGHSSLTTTQRYAHLAPNWADDVVSLLH